MLYSLTITTAWLYADTVANAYFNGYKLHDFIMFSYGISDIPSNLPRFYTQLLKYWYDFKKDNCEINVLDESLWVNENIKSGGKTIFYHEFYNNNMPFIKDIVQGNVIMPFLQAKLKFSLLDRDFLKYFTLTSAMPKEWTNIIRNGNNLGKSDERFYIFDCNSARINLLACKTREFYNILIDKYSVSPISIERWNEMYDNIDWERTFTLSFRILRDTKIQTLQYKILTRIFPCNSKLFQWKIINSPRCELCYEIDTIEHYLCECMLVKEFWKTFMHWWKQISDCYIHLKTNDILFGILIGDSIMFNSLNYCLLLAKRYIFVEKYNDRKLFFLAFLCDLKQRIETDIFIEKTKIGHSAHLEKSCFVYDKL